MFAWHGGADISYPLTPVITASLGLGLDHRAVEFHWQDYASASEERAIDYFYLAPGFQFSAFYLGLNIGFPVAGVRKWTNSVDAATHSAELDNTADKLNVMMEPRIGAIIPLLEKEVGWLGLTIEAGYNLNDLSDEPTFAPGPLQGGSISLQTATLMMGVTWQFGIPGTNRNKTPIPSEN